MVKNISPQLKIKKIEKKSVSNMNMVCDARANADLFLTVSELSLTAASFLLHLSLTYKYSMLAMQDVYTSCAPHFDWQPSGSQSSRPTAVPIRLDSAGKPEKSCSCKNSSCTQTNDDSLSLPFLRTHGEPKLAPGLPACQVCSYSGRLMHTAARRLRSRC